MKLVKIGKPLAEADKWPRHWGRFWTVTLNRLEALIGAKKEET